ncbi:MAG TPA: ornithine carbamoyltransferase [Verrucomicrobia bacterium]|nr:MAG: ornithine carbamoyltransferase [Lentisphaerae bacterium GWF2_57_35]HBA85019.1 ornithine carbamoyltransferase [Verrucomicrobiota bacterium]
MLHLLSLRDWSSARMEEAFALGREIKAHPEKFENVMRRKTLCMIFEKPSLRTRVSFETGMIQMGGHAIFYDTSTSPIGAGKESASDTIRTLSRYVNIIMARLFDHARLEEMARHATIPVINGLTNFSHPCQILADLMTILEHKGDLKGLKLAYLGDSFNNVTHSLLLGCTKMGMNINIGCPEGKAYSPDQEVLKEALRTGKKMGCEVKITHDPVEAVKGADVVYTDSWMSYHIPAHQLNERVRIFTPYQVNEALMKQASPKAIFMNCLPALRGYEQTADVIDGPQSVVFDEAENRLHIQKAIMLMLVRENKT